MINYRNYVSDEFKSIFRTLNDNSPKLSYKSGKIFNCHDGQRKLLYSEIEFYNFIGNKYNLEDILVVYVGSGEGLHMSIIFDLFPQLDFILIDPTKSLCKHTSMKNKDKVIQINDYYTDHSYKKIKELNTKNKKIAFMSDIREDLDEFEIWKNMIQQQLWCIQLDSIAYLLKFRLPYYNSDFKSDDFKYFLPLSDKKSIYEFKNFENMVNLKKKDKEELDVIYLKGDIYFQIYAPSKSSETRLMYIRKPDELFTFKNYNVKDYDEQCFYFNNVARNYNYKFRDSELVKYNILGFDDGYESVCEYLIIYQYFELIYKKYEKTGYIKNNSLKIIFENKNFSDTKKIINILYYLDLIYTNLTNKSLIECTFKSSIKRKAVPEKIKDKEEEIRVNKFVEIIKSKYFETIISMKNQISYFLSSDNNNIKMLNEKEYKEQIKFAKNILETINYYMKQILSKKYLKKDEKYFITNKIIELSQNKNINILSNYLLKNKNKIILSKNEKNVLVNIKNSQSIQLKEINDNYKSLLNDLKNIKKQIKSSNKPIDFYFE